MIERLQMSSYKNKLYIYLSLFAALSIDSLSFTNILQNIKPSFVLMVLVYWNMALPDKVGITTSLFFGLLVDVFEGSLLGVHALIFVLVAYLCQRFFYQFRVAPIWQQSFALVILSLIFRLILAIDYFDSIPDRINLSDSIYLLNSFYYSISTAVFWPVVYFSCRFYRRRFLQSRY